MSLPESLHSEEEGSPSKRRSYALAQESPVMMGEIVKRSRGDPRSATEGTRQSSCLNPLPEERVTPAAPKHPTDGSRKPQRGISPSRIPRRLDFRDETGLVSSTGVASDDNEMSPTAAASRALQSYEELKETLRDRSPTRISRTRINDMQKALLNVFGTTRDTTAQTPDSSITTSRIRGRAASPSKIPTRLRKESASPQKEEMIRKVSDTKLAATSSGHSEPTRKSVKRGVSPSRIPLSSKKFEGLASSPLNPNIQSKMVENRKTKVVYGEETDRKPSNGRGQVTKGFSRNSPEAKPLSIRNPLRDQSTGHPPVKHARGISPSRIPVRSLGNIHQNIPPNVITSKSFDCISDSNFMPLRTSSVNSLKNVMRGSSSSDGVENPLRGFRVRSPESEVTDISAHRSQNRRSRSTKKKHSRGVRRFRNEYSSTDESESSSGVLDTFEMEREVACLTGSAGVSEHSATFVTGDRPSSISPTKYDRISEQKTYPKQPLSAFYPYNEKRSNVTDKLSTTPQDIFKRSSGILHCQPDPPPQPPIEQLKKKIALRKSSRGTSLTRNLIDMPSARKPRSCHTSPARYSSVILPSAISCNSLHYLQHTARMLEYERPSAEAFNDRPPAYTPPPVPRQPLAVYSSSYKSDTRQSQVTGISTNGSRMTPVPMPRTAPSSAESADDTVRQNKLDSFPSPESRFLPYIKHPHHDNHKPRQWQPFSSNGSDPQDGQQSNSSNNRTASNENWAEIQPKKANNTTSDDSTLPASYSETHKLCVPYDVGIKAITAPLSRQLNQVTGTGYVSPMKESERITQQPFRTISRDTHSDAIDTCVGKKPITAVLNESGYVSAELQSNLLRNDNRGHRSPTNQIIDKSVEFGPTERPSVFASPQNRQVCGRDTSEQSQQDATEMVETTDGSARSDTESIVAQWLVGGKPQPSPERKAVSDESSRFLDTGHQAPDNTSVSEQNTSFEDRQMLQKIHFIASGQFKELGVESRDTDPHNAKKRIEAEQPQQVDKANSNATEESCDPHSKAIHSNPNGKTTPPNYYEQQLTPSDGRGAPKSPAGDNSQDWPSHDKVPGREQQEEMSIASHDVAVTSSAAQLIADVPASGGGQSGLPSPDTNCVPKELLPQHSDLGGLELAGIDDSEFFQRDLKSGSLIRKQRAVNKRLIASLGLNKFNKFSEASKRSEIAAMVVQSETKGQNLPLEGGDTNLGASDELNEASEPQSECVPAASNKPLDSEPTLMPQLNDANESGGKINNETSVNFNTGLSLSEMRLQTLQGIGTGRIQGRSELRNKPDYSRPTKRQLSTSPGRSLLQSRAKEIHSEAKSKRETPSKKIVLKKTGEKKQTRTKEPKVAKATKPEKSADKSSDASKTSKKLNKLGDVASKVGGNIGGMFSRLETQKGNRNEKSEEDVESRMVSDPGTEAHPVTVKTYDTRFYILGLFSVIALMECVIWGTWGPIMESARFAFPSWSSGTISLFNSWGPILCILFIVPITWLNQHYGLRVGIILAAALMAAGTLIRCIPAPEGTFTVLANVGAVSNAVSGCLTLSLPAMIAATWFPPSERTTATAVAGLFSQMGSAVMYLEPLVVRAPQSQYSKDECLYHSRDYVRQTARYNTQYIGSQEDASYRTRYARSVKRPREPALLGVFDEALNGVAFDSTNAAKIVRSKRKAQDVSNGRVDIAATTDNQNFRNRFNTDARFDRPDAGNNQNFHTGSRFNTDGRFDRPDAGNNQNFHTGSRFNTDGRFDRPDAGNNHNFHTGTRFNTDGRFGQPEAANNQNFHTGSRFNTDGRFDRPDAGNNQNFHTGTRFNTDGRFGQPEAGNNQKFHTGSRFNTDGRFDRPDAASNQNFRNRFNTDGGFDQPNAANNQNFRNRFNTDGRFDQPDAANNQNFHTGFNADGRFAQQTTSEISILGNGRQHENDKIGSLNFGFRFPPNETNLSSGDQVNLVHANRKHLNSDRNSNNLKQYHLIDEQGYRADVSSTTGPDRNIYNDRQFHNVHLAQNNLNASSWSDRSQNTNRFNGNFPYRDYNNFQSNTTNLLQSSHPSLAENSHPGRWYGNRNLNNTGASHTPDSRYSHQNFPPRGRGPNGALPINNFPFQNSERTLTNDALGTDPSNFHNDFNAFGDGYQSSRSLIAEDIRGDIMVLMYIHAGIAVLLLIVAVVYFPAKPILPPSPSSAVQRLDYFAAVKVLVKNGQFLLLVCTYIFSVGVPIVWVAVMNFSLCCIGIRQEQSMYVAITAVMMSCLAAFVAARVTDLIYGYLKITVITLLLLSSACFLWFLLLSVEVIPTDIVQVYLSVGGGTALQYATVPLLIELAVELAYPCPESVVGAFLTWCFNIVSGVFLLLFLIPSMCYTWVNIVLVGCTSLTVVPMLFVKETHNRRADDNKGEGHELVRQDSLPQEDEPVAKSSNVHASNESVAAAGVEEVVTEDVAQQDT